MLKFNLTEEDVQDILEQAKYEAKEWDNQPLMLTEKANEFIEEFKVKVTDEVWNDWCEYNDDEDVEDEDCRTTLILNLFNEMYNGGELGIIN